MPRDQVSENELATRAYDALPHRPVPASDAVLRLLETGRAKLAQGWCRAPFAVMADGRSVYGVEESDLQGAVCFCSVGAQRAAMYEMGVAYRDVMGADVYLGKAARRLGHLTPVGLNQHTDQATVLRMWDLAIAARQAELASELTRAA